MTAVAGEGFWSQRVSALAPFALALALCGSSGALRGAPVPWLPALLHGAASVLVFEVMLLAVGSEAAARFSGSLYAVAAVPALAAGPAAAPGSSTGFALCAGLLALVFAIRVRPDPWLSALATTVAIVLAPAAVPLVLVIALATRRVPWLHLGALAIAVASRLLDEPTPAEPSALTLGLPPIVLAVALAGTLRPGPIGLRAGVWCAGLVGFALPWGYLLHGSGPGAGAGDGLLTLALAGLAAEASLALRWLAAPLWLAPTLEALLVVLVAVRS